MRTEEEVAAKRARRNKRNREKGRKKADEPGAEKEETEIDADGDGVKWEERVQAWCIVRANAKVKSFSLGPDEVGTKGGIPVRRALVAIRPCDD